MAQHRVVMEFSGNATAADLSPNRRRQVRAAPEFVMTATSDPSGFSKAQ
jgi:hypothetical protein